MESLVKELAVLDKLRKIYEGKRVFITGHTGFKGSWLLTLLHELGAEITGYALEPETEPSMFKLIGGDTLCHHIIGDIRDAAHLQSALKESKADFVFHLAAQPLVRKSYQEPTDTFSVNVMGTAYILEAIRCLEYPCIGVMITTDKVYENKEWWHPYREIDPLGGYDPYSASKAASEIVISSYRSSFFHPDQYFSHQKAIASARAGNVIGGGDWSKDRIIPDTIRALEAGKKLIMRNPASVRPWQHVLEPLCGYLMLGALLHEDPRKYSGAYNFGPRIEDACSVHEMVKVALQSWGSGSFDIQQDQNAPHEAKLLMLDISKAINELKWSPQMNYIQAIEMTMDWYKHYGNGALELTKSQILTYFGI